MNRFSSAAAAILAAAIVGGCANKGATVTYSYEPRFSLPESGTYRWGKAKSPYQPDSLVEANVRFLADRALEAKGLTARTDKAGLLVWIGYDFDPVYGEGHDLRELTVNIARSHDNVVLWRGLATGVIKTDAASGELKRVVDEMFDNFPPKPALPAAESQAAAEAKPVPEVKLAPGK